MEEIPLISAIDQKMAEMRIKNLELLKRHQEIEEDRQLAIRLGATSTAIETIQNKNTMKGTQNRVRVKTNQEKQNERINRPPVRRKLENDRKDNYSQRAQRVDYNRLKNEHSQELNKQKQKDNDYSINSELYDYVNPFQYQFDNNNDADEPSHAKKLVIVNNKADRIGSGRFSQQQRAQDRGQRKREERMRRCAVQNNGHTGGTNEFHLDVPPMPIWPTGPIPSMHVQLVPTAINGIDHIVNTSGEQMEQSNYIQNFIYSPSAQTSPFTGNSTVYFAHPATPIATTPSSSQPHFHSFQPSRTFENSNRHQFHLPSLQSLTPNNQQKQQDTSSTDFSSNFRRLRSHDHENQSNQQRPMSGDIERLHNSHQTSSSSFRFHSRTQSFYDNSVQQQSNNNFRSSNPNRYQRNNNNNNNNNNITNTNTNSLPLSAYMNTNDSLNQNENNQWGTTYQRRRPIQQRSHHQDKHQFPLSSYDPRQYGFRNDFNNQWNSNRRPNRNINHNLNQDSTDIDLIEEWWEDSSTELIETNRTTLDNESNKTKLTIDDSGNSSLSTSIHLKDDSMNQQSDISTADSNIIESLDKLQEQLKFEEAVDQRLLSTIQNDNMKTKKELTTYDTAHFMQWAKEKFREELAGRLTAQEIQQHDAVATDDDDDDEDIDDQLPKTNKEKLNALEDDLNEKLKIDENQTKSIDVE